MKQQVGFADGWATPKLGQNEFLGRLANEIEWHRFETLLRRLKPEGPGRPPFDVVLMLKAILLQQWYDLSDAGLEDALNDRMSFRHFVGLGLEDCAPDHTSLCRFRNRLAETGLAGHIFEEFQKQLEQRGLLMKKGTMIDASLVQTPHRPPSQDGSRAAVDTDAARMSYAGRKGTHYGYKIHAGVDQGSGIIRKVLVTPANVSDTVPADQMVCGDERAVYADRAYAKRERRQWLKSQGIKARIMHKTWGGGPQLTFWQKRHNQLIKPVRAAVEGVFATLKRWYGFRQVRYRGLAKNNAHFLLLTTAYNMKRSLKLT
jgi:transposase, IS5 family